MNHNFFFHLMLTFFCAGIYFVIPENPGASVRHGDTLVVRDATVRAASGGNRDLFVDPKAPLKETQPLRDGAKASELKRENQEFLPLKVRGDRVYGRATSSI